MCHGIEHSCRAKEGITDCGNLDARFFLLAGFVGGGEKVRFSEGVGLCVSLHSRLCFKTT